MTGQLRQPNANAGVVEARQVVFKKTRVPVAIEGRYCTIIFDFVHKKSAG
jgi:hypothetical protein